METVDVKPTGAEPSAAPQFTQFDAWDEKGNPIVSSKKDTPQKADSAPADAPKVETSEAKAESAAESEAAKKQQESRRKPDAEERISELIARSKAAEDRAAKLEERLRNLESAPKPTTDKQPTQQQQPQTYAEWRKSFKPNDWIQQYAKENPNATLEEGMAACADYQADVRDAYRQLGEQQRQATEQSQKMLSKTIEKYPDAEAKVKQTARDLSKAPLLVQQFVNDSEVMTDLLYALSDPATMTNVLETAKTNPGKVLRMLRDMELDVEKAIAKPAADRDESGKFKKADAAKEEADKETPVEAKPRAPKPVSEVGGRGAVTDDALATAAKANDFRAFEAEQRRRAFGSR